MPTSRPLDFDVWLLKLDIGGNVVWQRTYHGGGDGYAHAVQPTADGGFIVAASLLRQVGGFDAWVLKVDANGNIVWQKTYGDYGEDTARSVQVTPDGGYLVAGWTDSFGLANAWVLKLDASGNVPCANSRASVASSINGKGTTADGSVTGSASDANVRSASAAQDTAQESPRRRCNCVF